MKRVAIYGATGTVGDSALALIDAHPEQFSIAVLTAHANIKKLAQLAERYQPQCVVISAPESADDFRTLCPNYKGEVLCGVDGLLEATHVPTDIALMAIVGFAALQPTLALLKQNVPLALANKECLVVAGELIMKQDARILPVDSEHNAIFQLLAGHDRAHIDKIVLTASGGPFRTKQRRDMASVTPAQAVAHPTWNMGAKISVDSATLMNKGLELIEAHYLFAIPPAQLDVIVHPESVVHGLVYFRDGAVLAQKSLPDMRVPLASALAYPDRLDTQIPPLDLAAIGTLTFEAADREQFPCLRLAEQALAAGGFAPTILNAANEVAVQGFLEQRIGFLDIEAVVSEALAQPAASMGGGGKPTALEAIIACDQATRIFCQQALEQRIEKRL